MVLQGYAYQSCLSGIRNHNPSICPGHESHQAAGDHDKDYGLLELRYPSLIVGLDGK